MPNEQANSRKSFFGCWLALSKLDYGLEQAGMETIWQVEDDDWCREVALPKNFPNTEKFRDVREVGKHNLRAVDVICGGFPCQDISQANRNKNGGKGLNGDRSGLWSEYFRIICELQPRYALIENVAKLAVRGLDRVLCDLASIGFDAEWQTLSSEEFGLPTVRKRLFIVAFAKSQRPEKVPAFKRAMYQTRNAREVHSRPFTSYLKDIGRSVIQIPEHLRMDNGTAFELPEIERAIKAYGNGVAIPVARFVGEQIIRFDKEIKEYEQNNYPPSPILTATSE